MSREGSRVVFVGNIPYDGTEQQLSELFSEVGKVLSFRLVSDRETGKPKGFGFCEYGDAETAQSAIRNLNNVDFHGRNLRVDYADDDKATIGGQAAKARVQPKKRLGVDAISQVIDELSTEEQIEVLSQMKSFIESDPDSARQLLTHNQQLAQAMLRLLVLFDGVTPADIQGLTLPAAAAAPPPSSGPSGPPPMQMSSGPMRRGPPPQMQGPGPDMRRAPSSNMRPRMPQGPPRRPSGPLQRPMMHGAHGGHGPMPALPRARGVPPGPGPPPHNDLPPEAQEMLQKVMAMSPDEIAALPPATQRQIQMLRQRVSGARGPPSGARAPLPPHRRPLPRDGPPKRRHRGRDAF